MKLRVVFNEQGNILAAVVLGAEVPNGQPAAIILPVTKEGDGRKTADVSVPLEFSHLDLRGIAQCLRVDI